MKKCPYCAEEIQDEAAKCRFCGEFVDLYVPPKAKWYFRTSTIVIALLSIGPFALPMVWFNPHYNTKTKVIVTAIGVVLTVVAVILFFYIINLIYEYAMQLITQQGVQ